MGFFGQLGKLALDIIETPVAVVSDVLTLGGTLTESDSYTGKKMDDIADDYQGMKDLLDDE